MEYFTDSETLKFVWSRLSETNNRLMEPGISDLVWKIAKNGWVLEPELKEMAGKMDTRLNTVQADFEKLAAIFGIQWQLICYRPAGSSFVAPQFKALRTEDAALFLIELDRLGFHTHCDILNDTLLSDFKLREKSLMNRADLQIFWHRKNKGNSLVNIRTNPQDIPVLILDSFYAGGGYKVIVKGTKDRQPCEMEIRSRNYTAKPEAVLTTCVECGFEYYQVDRYYGDLHKTIHKKRMNYLDPQPNSLMLAEREKPGDPELVTPQSQAWKHKEMNTRYDAYKQDFEPALFPWPADKRLIDPSVKGLLLTKDNGSIVGACAFRMMMSSGEPLSWLMIWVYICPRENYKDHLTIRWKKLHETFGDFRIALPVPGQLQEFLVEIGAEEKLITI